MSDVPPKPFWAIEETRDEPAPSLVAQCISEQEWKNARRTPPAIVEGYLFHDVSLVLAAGGVGKTTVILWEAVHIALGKPLYERRIVSPGMTVFITAEDSREQMVARLRNISQQMGLNNDEIAMLRDEIRPLYVGGTSFRLSAIQDDVVAVGPETYRLVETLLPLKDRLRMVVIDPAVSFGVGEQRVNDSEQGLISAGRYIRDQLECCPRILHHTGKGNARSKSTDQYSGRGGSSMPDGSRLVQVFNPLGADEWFQQTGTRLGEEEAGIQISFAKTSYTKRPPDIFLRRNDHLFTPVESDGATYLDEKQISQLKRRILSLGYEPRHDSQSPEWVGHQVAEVLGLNSGLGLGSRDRDEAQKKVCSHVTLVVKQLIEGPKAIFVVKTRPRQHDGRSQKFVALKEE